MHKDKQIAVLQKRTGPAAFIGYVVLQLAVVLFSGVFLNFLYGERIHHVSQDTFWTFSGISILGLLLLFTASFSLAVERTMQGNYLVVKTLKVFGVAAWKREYSEVVNVFYKTVSLVSDVEETLALFVKLANGKTKCLTPLHWLVIFNISSSELVTFRSQCVRLGKV